MASIPVTATAQPRHRHRHHDYSVMTAVPTDQTRSCSCADVSALQMVLRSILALNRPRREANVANDLFGSRIALHRSIIPPLAAYFPMAPSYIQPAMRPAAALIHRKPSWAHQP